VKKYLADLEKSARAATALPDLTDLHAALTEWESAAGDLDARVAAALVAATARRTARSPRP